MVIEVARLGARAPSATTGVYSFGVEWDIMPSDLTEIGERQHYLLGAKRRKQYIGKSCYESFSITEIMMTSKIFKQLSIKSFSYLCNRN